MSTSLQWGGRFSAPPDGVLLAFGSSLEEDLVLAPFDVRCSQAHVAALESGGILTRERAEDLRCALDAVQSEIEDGAFATYARRGGAEDVHGAIDARVRELAPESGAFLHAGRSRNDQVATTLLLYCADRTLRAKKAAARIAALLCDKAEEELAALTPMAGMTHWQPAQPMLLAFWLCAAAQPFVRDAHRLAGVQKNAMRWCPLGSGAISGSSLPLDRRAAAMALGFEHPSRNALDAVGNRDAALDAAHAIVRTVMSAARICEELVMWFSPAYGYARLGDAASTGSSLMPQKRNPDPFELVRATASDLAARLMGAFCVTSGIALSYHRDLQVSKRAVIEIVERAIAALEAFERALSHVQFVRERMHQAASENFTVATDVADALIERGVTAREAHAQVGALIARAEREGRALNASDLDALAKQNALCELNAPLDAASSIAAKMTGGSTRPDAVADNIAALKGEITDLLA